MKKQNILKKSYEEEEEIIANKNNISGISISNKNSRKNSISKINTSATYSNSLNASVNIVTSNNNNLLVLVESLKEKINFYENEMRNLIDEKIQMQMIINNLQKSNPITLNDKNSNGLKNELKNLKLNIERQKLLLEQNCSIIDDNTIDNNKIQFSNIDGNISGNILATLNTNNRSQNMTQIYEGNNKSNSEMINLANQREMIMTEIKTLKDELISLVDLQKSLNIMNLNESASNNNNLNDKSNLVINQINNSELNNSNVQLNITNNKIQNSFSNNEALPNIELFFVFNNKFSLVDSEKNLWHLKKCRKYEEFTNYNNYNTKEENLSAFLENYQNMKNNKEENNCVTDDINSSELCKNIKTQNLTYNSRNQNNLTTHSDRIKITDNYLEDNIENEDENDYQLSDSN